jgi:uncharacterized paraquat-inducible protein A
MPPLYSYHCDDCDRGVVEMRLEEERNECAKCDRCGQDMKLVEDDLSLRAVIRSKPFMRKNS